MFETIVWATDGSKHADSALPVVTKLAGAHRARIVVLHLDERFRGSRANGSTVRAGEDEVREKLESQVEDLRAAGFEARLEIVTTFGHDTAASVAGEAAKLGAGLIVVGTHGYGELEAVFLGGIARGLMHHATCPVLVVPPRARIADPAADSAYAFPWSL